MARPCSSGVALPLATFLRISRDCGVLIWASTKSAWLLDPRRGVAVEQVLEQRHRLAPALLWASAFSA